MITTTKKFKINTATGKQAMESVSVLQKVLNSANINYSQWVSLFFEIGCEFVEMYISEKDMQVKLLQEKKYGFWDWFIIIYLIDDEQLLTYPYINNYQDYVSEKYMILHLLNTSKQFDYFIERNKKMQIIQ